MSKASNNQIAEAIYDLSKEKNAGELASLFPKISAFLWRKRLLSESEDILLKLEKIINEREGKLVAKVYSVEKIGEKTRKELKTKLATYYPNKDIFLEENLEAGLLGGLKIVVDDEVIDLSLKNRIRKLEEHLTKSA